MTRLVRIDDFPHGDKRLFFRGDGQRYRTLVSQTLEIFEKNSIDYILGVTPMLFQIGDIDFLNKNVKRGKCVYHGFTHGWERDWSTITSCWPTGGEFSGLSEEQIEERYIKTIEIMRQIDSFDHDHFIAPFNCYNQELLNFLKNTPTKIIHTSDEFWESYGLSQLQYYNMKPEVSKYKVTYDDADKVINNLSDSSQITLHWCYDAQRPSWQKDYQNLCDKINEATQ